MKLAKKGAPLKRRSRRKAQMVTVRPSPLLTGIATGLLSAMRGKPPEQIACDAIGAAMEQTDTRKCRCGAFMLWAADEAAPVCRDCGADLTNAPKATREDVRQSFDDWNKPKH